MFAYTRAYRARAPTPICLHESQAQEHHFMMLQLAAAAAAACHYLRVLEIWRYTKRLPASSLMLYVHILLRPAKRQKVYIQLAASGDLLASFGWVCPSSRLEIRLLTFRSLQNPGLPPTPKPPPTHPPKLAPSDLSTVQ